RVNAGKKLEVRVEANVTHPPGPSSGLSQCITTGAKAGLVYRLLLALPNDIYARIMTQPQGGTPRPCSFASWALPTTLDSAYVRHLVLTLAWLGIIIGVVLVRHRSRRVTDILFGVISGFAGGIAAIGTLACSMPWLDSPARLVWSRVND